MLKPHRMLIQNMTTWQKSIFKGKMQLQKKHTIKKMKRRGTDWEKIFTALMSEKVLIPKMCKELL